MRREIPLYLAADLFRSYDGYAGSFLPLNIYFD